VARIRLTGGELDGLELHVVEAGRGPATLLIHGLGAFAESWRRTLDALSPQCRLIALDLPGFGQSAKPRRAYTLTFFAGAVAGLLRALGVDRVRVVGHSLGGAVAAAMALAHPHRVERVALLSAVVPGFPVEPSWVYRLMVLPGLGEVMAGLVTPGICRYALTRCFVVPPDPEEIDFLVGHEFAVRATAEGRAAYLSALRGVRAELMARGAEFRKAMSRLERPVLLVHGRQDRVIPFSHAAAAAQAIPGAEARWLERCGHFPHLEHADAVHALLGEFLLARASH
jgi:pimeloyl-ACP methyl ester carboxylesterase